MVGNILIGMSKNLYQNDNNNTKDRGDKSFTVYRWSKVVRKQHEVNRHPRLNSSPIL